MKALPHLQQVKAYAIAHKLPHFFLKDLLKADEIHSNTCKCIHEAGWIAGLIITSETAGKLDSCNRLIELFKLKWISDKKKNPVTTANPWLLYEQLHKHLCERQGEIVIKVIDFDNDSAIHPEWNYSPEGEE